MRAAFIGGVAALSLLLLGAGGSAVRPFRGAAASSGSGASSQWQDGGTQTIYYSGTAGVQRLVVDGGVIQSTVTTGPLIIRSDTTAASAAYNAGAVTIQTTNALDDGDDVFNVLLPDAGMLFEVSGNGDTYASGDVYSEGEMLPGNGIRFSDNTVMTTVPTFTNYWSLAAGVVSTDNTVEMTGVTGSPTLKSASTSEPLSFVSVMDAATASTTVAPFRFRNTSVLNADDLVWESQKSDGTSLLKWDVEGDVTAASSFNVPTGGRIDVGSGSKDYFASDGGTVYTEGPFAALALYADGGVYLTQGKEICIDWPSCNNRLGYTSGAFNFQTFASFGFNAGMYVYGLVNSAHTVGPNFQAAAASGEKAFNVTTNGARIDFGAGASDYASSNGTTVTFAGPLAASNLSGTNTGDDVSFQKQLAWGATCFGVCSADVIFAGPFRPEYAAFARRMICSAGTNGVVGGSTVGYVLEVYDVTAAAVLGTLTASCNPGAGTYFSSDSTGNMTFTTGNRYQVRVKSNTDCGTSPANVVCNVVFSQ